jgi:hypothetical protein
MEKLEVRCCCDPGKLLGWLAADISQPSVCYPIMESHTSKLDALMVKTIALQIARFVDQGQAYWAIKADGVPVETLRLIPGFEENPDTRKAAAYDAMNRLGGIGKSYADKRLREP